MNGKDDMARPRARAEKGEDETLRSRTYTGCGRCSLSASEGSAVPAAKDR